MPEKLRREAQTFGPVTLTTNAATSFRIPMGQASGAIVQIITSSTDDTITWHSCVSSLADAATYAVRDSAGAAVTQALIRANRAYAVPDQLFPAVYAIPVMTTGTATAFVTVKG
jgi:hypothetical protein